MSKSGKATPKRTVKKRRSSKLQRRFRVVTSKIKKIQKQHTRHLRKQKRLLIKRKKQLLKRLSKLNRTSSKLAKKPRSKSRPKTSRNHNKTNLYTIKFLLLLVVASSIVGFFCGHLWAQGYADVFGTGSKKKTEASSKITSFGPSQPNLQFSTYPIWAQDFAKASGQPDSKYWNVFQGEPPNDNHEAQYYTADPANVHIDKGSLSLVATHETQPQGYKYASARVDTNGKQSFLYGRIDVTAKLPSGVGTWPAIWLLPANNKYAYRSPSSDGYRHINGGELDMMEAVGFNPDVIYSVVHTRSDLKNVDHIGAFNQLLVPGNDSEYNTYSMLWTPASITYEVNGKPFFTYTKSPGADYTTWPFDQPFYLIMNLALGGNWGGEDTTNFPGNGIDNSALPASLDIKSVYYYPYIGPR
jgi:beta-glucanase (GH16 family)